MDAPEDPSSVWDLTYLLDFNLDGDTPFPLNHPQQQQFPPLPDPFPPDPNPNNHDVDDEVDIPPSDSRVRKRDPRLACSNFLAGRIPCACPEMDAMLEDDGLPGKKRVRTARASSSARCQVPGCEVDISELKGYHRRHRVCLSCANASTVQLHGEAKRYCQQCGK